MENLLNKLLDAVDEVVLYKTNGKIQALKKVREEIRNELASQTLTFKKTSLTSKGGHNDR